MQKRDHTQIYYRLLQAITYISASVFLLTDVNVTNLQLKVVGWIFLGIAFVLVIATFSNHFVGWAAGLDRIFLLGLFFATVAVLIRQLVDAADFKTLFIFIFIFILLVLAALIRESILGGAKANRGRKGEN